MRRVRQPFDLGIRQLSAVGALKLPGSLSYPSRGKEMVARSSRVFLHSKRFIEQTRAPTPTLPSSGASIGREPGNLLLHGKATERPGATDREQEREHMVVA